MTKELLEQYPDICEEIRGLEEQKRRGVSDIVSGSSPEYPYNQHTIKIKGEPPDLHARLEGLKKLKTDIEDWVNSLKSREKLIVTYRALKKMTWPQVAAKMGHRYTENKVKYRYYEAIKNFQ